MKKCIILSRVSTDVQDITEQEQNLFNFALKDGYKDSNIISISDKESGIMLSEEERNGLNQLKEYINNDSIECVYVWELSRIARSPKVLYSIRDFLVEHKVQLKVYDPSLTLLNSDYTINENSSLVFGLYASMAEAEMRQKKIRFKRGKIRNAKIGKFNGGLVKYGYSLDENNFLIENKEEADIVRLIYSIYLSGKSVKQTYNELKERGINLTFSGVKNILLFEGYTGSMLVNNIEKKYPPIIDKYTFSEKKVVAKNNNLMADKSKNIYLCRSLIICKNCGTAYLAVKGNGQYLCTHKYYEKYTDQEINDCKTSPININLIDSIVWHYSKKLQLSSLLSNYEDERTKYLGLIEVNKQKINSTVDKFNTIQQKRERNNYMYENLQKTQQQYNKRVKEINEEEKEIRSQVEKWENENKQYLQLIENLNNVTSNKDLENFILNNDSNLNTLENRQMMYDIIHNNIKKITVEDEIKFKTKLIEIYDNYDRVLNLRVNIRTKVLESRTKEGIYIPIEYQFLKTK